MIDIIEYLDADGTSPFANWFKRLSATEALKVSTYITRLEHGNFSNLKSVGSGVSELKINWGPGYRVYIGRDGDTLLILLGGGTKKRQQHDIDKAKERWKNYKTIKNIK